MELTSRENPFAQNADAMFMLQYCWPTCIEYFAANSAGFTASELIYVDLVGKPLVLDPFSIEHPVCDLGQGWTSLARRNFLTQLVNANISFNSDLVPRYTAKGFLKRRFPEEMWRLVRSFYDTTSFVKGKPGKQAKKLHRDLLQFK